MHRYVSATHILTLYTFPEFVISELPSCPVILNARHLMQESCDLELCDLGIASFIHQTAEKILTE